MESKFLPFLQFPGTIVPYSTHRWKPRCRVVGVFFPTKGPSRLPRDCHIVWALSGVLVDLPGSPKVSSSLHSSSLREDSASPDGTALSPSGKYSLHISHQISRGQFRYLLLNDEEDGLPKGNISFSVSIAKNNFKRSLFRLFVLSSLQAWRIALESPVTGDEVQRRLGCHSNFGILQTLTYLTVERSALSLTLPCLPPHQGCWQTGRQLL